ncbi:Secreted protein [Phytophthora megakarya]|uniref:Secreted protein n=1 Tax=Phytophthora megakarya TaxID=4795 RepID=A0A225VW46_9STRA|nr:Secreted protein [Phytophthora megakarya]
MIHYISFPGETSINNMTDQDNIDKSDHVHRDAITTEILRLIIEVFDTIFRNTSLLSDSVRWFAGVIKKGDTLIAVQPAPFSWTGRFVQYSVWSDCSRTCCRWMDGQSDVAANVGTNSANMDRLLRCAMLVSISGDKSTGLEVTQRSPGLQFNTVGHTVSIPESKITKAYR